MAEALIQEVMARVKVLEGTKKLPARPIPIEEKTAQEMIEEALIDNKEVFKETLNRSNKGELVSKQAKSLVNIPKWDGKEAIGDWVKDLVSWIGSTDITLLPAKMIKSNIFRALDKKKKEQVSHLGEFSNAMIHDTIPEYVQRLVGAFAPGLHSATYREAFYHRKQGRDESGAAYTMDKHKLYRKGFQQYDFPVFITAVIQGLCNPELVRVMVGLRDQIENIEQLQESLNTEAAKLRTLATHPICPQGTLTGLKVDIVAPDLVHAQAGTHPMEINSVDLPSKDEMQERMERLETLLVAALQQNSNGGRNQGICYNCQAPGHLARSCPKSNQGKLSNQGTCGRCKKPGHRAEKCTAKIPVCNWCKKINHKEEDCRQKMAGKPQVFQD